MKNIFTRTFILFMSLTSGLYASASIVSNRPSFTTGTYTLKPDVVVLEVGYRNTFKDTSSTDTFGLFDLRFGLTSRFEVDLLWSGKTFSYSNGTLDRSSFSDTAIGSKYRLVEHTNYNLSLLTILSLPSGSAISTSKHVDPIMGLSWDYALSSTTLAFGIFQATSYVDSDKRVYDVQPAIGLAFSHSSGWGSFVEYFSTVPLRSTGTFTHAIDMGATYLINNDFQWDINGAVGLNKASENYIATGLAYRF